MEFIGTFSVNTRLRHKFVRIQAASRNEARLMMQHAYKTNWAFLYDSEKEAGVARWRLQEVEFGTPNQWEDK